MTARRRCVQWPAILAATLLALGLARPAVAEIDTEVAFSALRHRLCEISIEVSGRSRSAVVRKDGDIAYVKLDDLIWQYPRRSVPQSALFGIYAQEGEAAVFHLQEFPQQGQGDFVAQFEQKFLAGPQEPVEFVEPTDCTRQFVDTPMKLRFLRIVEETMARQFFMSNKRGFTQMPPRLKIVVKNFNFDSMGTYVLVPRTGEVWEFSFHSAFNPLHALESGEFVPLSLPDGRARQLRKRILAQGLTRGIELHE